ncbi:MAG: hypothetical protein ACLPPF_18340 [Rhodomicrobium sp.]
MQRSLTFVTALDAAGAAILLGAIAEAARAKSKAADIDARMKIILS